MLKTALSSLFFILLLSCNNENILEPNDNYPNPIDSSFTFTWEVYYNTTGLTTNWIKDIEFAKNNNIWVATYYDGIIKFDGGTKTEFNSHNSGLPCDTINDISIDSFNNLWVGTINGLAKYDGINWIIYNNFNSPLANNDISSIYVDKNNIKWIGWGYSDEGGLLSFDDNIWNLYTPYNSILPTGTIDEIYVDANNVKWIGTGWGIGGTGALIKIENEKWTLYDENNPGLPYNSVQCISSDKKNNLWFGMSAWIYSDPNYMHGSLVKYDGKNWVEHKPEESGKTSNRVTAIVADHFGYLWVATTREQTHNYELSIYDGSKWIVLSSIDNNFPHTFILDLKVDTDNNIWVASVIGVIKITPHY